MRGEKRNTIFLFETENAAYSGAMGKFSNEKQVNCKLF